MPIFASPAVTVPDIEHTFYFDPTFKDVHLGSNYELKFFSEALSLIDSMQNIDLLHRFVNKIRKTKGILYCRDLIELLREVKLIEATPNLWGSEKDEGLQFLLDSFYRILNRIVMDKFVSCLHTSSLGCVAWEVGQLYSDQNNNNEEQEKSRNALHWKEKHEAWCDLSERLQELAKYQQNNLKIHDDFQKSNYAPDPRSKFAYGSTAVIILIGFLYLCLKNVTRSEAKELVNMLLR